jgi:hypothetical protein
MAIGNETLKTYCTECLPGYVNFKKINLKYESELCYGRVMSVWFNMRISTWDSTRFGSV